MLCVCVGGCDGCQWKLVLIVQAAFSQVQPTVHTSKLGRHTSSSETRLVTRETKRKSLDGTDIHHGSSEESNQEL